MKKTTTTLAFAVAMMVMTIPAAAANSENSNDTAGYGTEQCRPGAENNELIGGWETITQDAYTAELIASVPSEHPDYDYIVNVLIPQSSQATWDFCDKNLDGILCVLRTEPSPYSYLLLDNRPFKAA